MKKNTPYATNKPLKNHCCWIQIFSIFFIFNTAYLQALEVKEDSKILEIHYESNIKDTLIEKRIYQYYKTSDTIYKLFMNSETVGFFSLFRKPYEVQAQIMLKENGISRVSAIEENNNDSKSFIKITDEAVEFESNSTPIELPKNAIITTAEFNLFSLFRYLKHTMKKNNSTWEDLENKTITTYIPYTVYDDKEQVGRFFTAKNTIKTHNAKSKTVHLYTEFDKSLIEQKTIYNLTVHYEDLPYAVEGSVNQTDLPFVEFNATSIYKK